MPGLHFYRSNRLETLAERLCVLLREPLSSVLQPEMIVVQSLGMRRWLSLQLAEQLGVTMNCQFPFPASFAHSLFRSVFSETPAEPAFARENLPWRVMSVLPSLLQSDDAESLRNYLSGEMGDLKRFQLAGKIATVFDRYMVHRAEKLLGWQVGRPTKEWQGRLWRELIEGYEKTNPPALLRRLLDRIEAGETEISDLPERIAIFGASSLSPFYIQLLGAASHCIEVHLFLLEPTEHYWGDIQSTREQENFLRRHATEGQSAEDFHLDAGNPLLASMGKPAREFARSIQALDAEMSEELFAEPTTHNLLSSIRADIFHLRDRRTEGSPRDSVAADDRSIQVHCCHGPMREVEVLYDHLLDLFEKLPGLTPKDILVMMPDVEAYAPFIDAVFGAPEDDSLRIPFTIADRSVQSESPVAHALRELINLHGSRFGAASVLAVLESESIRRRFGLREEDLKIIRMWVERAGIRWGIDGKHRTTFDVPEFEQNSWRAGLDRLLLGYALPGDGRQLYGEILPIAEIEGERAEMLGRFVDFTDKLFHLIPALAKARPLDEWAEALRELVTTFFDESDDSVDEISRLRKVFENLEELKSYYAEPVTFDVMRAHLAAMFSDTESGFGFLAGHTTFCSLKPMRSVPFRVICVLGLNDTAFPRSDTPIAFDLAGSDAQPGDRSRRDDDRQLFLETLLSARDTLYLSYSGRSQRDQSETPPSVVVSELLDYIEANYELEDESGSIRNHLLTKHRLQAFSPAYFGGDDRLFSYSAENGRACESRDARQQGRRAFMDRPLAEPEPNWRNVDVHRLAEFFCNPARFFVRERLGLYLPETPAALEEREPIALNALEKTLLRSDVISHTRAGLTAQETLAIARASGRLPVGWSGDTLHREVAGEANALLSRMRELLDEPLLAPLNVDLPVGPWRVTGILHDLHPSAALRFRAASTKTKDRLRAWVTHVVLNVMAADGYPRETVVYGVKDKLVLRPLENAQELLSDLLAVYELGLRRPLPLFPETCWAYAKTAWASKKAQPQDAPVKAAREVWEGGGYITGMPGEREDECVQLCFRDCVDPLDGTWEEMTRRVFEPIVRASADNEDEADV